MKKLNVIILIAFMAIACTGFAQQNTGEVLFFKAELSCCKARACEQLEKDIKSMVEESFSDNELAFRSVKIADKENKALVNKYNAKSQTVVVVADKKGKEKSIDISDLVARYQKTQNKEAVKKEIVDKIKTIL
ncbi:MAG: hypothetical protein PF590_00415 [Candidatus Delongbacteria bacterium]|jgi:hypothetical protein|nr:hypothetical protein [Candidatus Delongbacteria bacterium]